jgi:hypothetical protein
MVSLDEVARIALALPLVSEGERHGTRSWAIAGKVFAWERNFSKADLRRYGSETPPDGPIIGIRVDDLIEKEAVLASAPKGFFTIPHFDGYAAVLVHLKVATKRDVSDALADGWAAMAPASVVAEHVRGGVRRRV